MPRNEHLILGIHIKDRETKALEIQKLLGEYGCYIRTRLGLHEASADYCSPAGLILVEMVGDRAVADELAGKLKALPGIEVQRMLFGHD